MRICKTNVMLFKMLTILFVKGFKSSFKFLLRILCSIRKTQPTSLATKPLLNQNYGNKAPCLPTFDHLILNFYDKISIF